MRSSALLVTLVLLVAGNGTSRADTPLSEAACGGEAPAGDADASGADEVVATVGRASVRASELGYHLGRLRPFERETYGHSPMDVRRGLLDRRLVPGLLGALRACELGLDKSPSLAELLRMRLSASVTEELTREADRRLTPKEIKSYCETHEGDAGAAKCDGDLSGHRVALRRIKASLMLAELVGQLRERDLKSLSYAPLEEIEITAAGVVARPR